MKNHIKQILRTPMQSVFIIVLVMIVTVMLTVGGNLWVASDRLSKTYDRDFTTIGTVTQKPDTVQDNPRWDAEKKDYRIYKENRYNRYVTPEDLKFSEVKYLVEPEKRVYWGSYVPEYLLTVDTKYDVSRSGFVAEFSPMEDCVPDESVKVSVTKVLGSDKTMEGSVLWFCDHYNREPMELKADRSYIAWIGERPWRHGKRWEQAESSYLEQLEYYAQPVDLTLYEPEGTKIEDAAAIQSIYEVSEGFYDTEIGKRFLELEDMAIYIFDTQPVVGTNSTDLIMPFYEGNAWVYEGRYPTAEEYAEGSAVCLAPRTFVENNELTVGDKVTTRLYFTDARRGPQVLPGFNFSLLGPEGELLKPFEEKDYTIVGLYDHKPLVEGIGYDELIVPLNSVQNQTANIVDYGAMADENTSFQIENGTIADFMEVSAKYDTDNLIFTFYDRGYSALMEGIENLRNMSITLLVMGVIAAIVLSLQISHIYITKRKRQLSIERLMGMTRKRCRHISMAGILVLLILGTVPGMVAGMILADEISMSDRGQKTGAQVDEKSPEMTTAGQEVDEGRQDITEQTEGYDSRQIDGTSEEFSRKYSNLELAVEMDDIDLSMQTQGSMAVSGIMGGLIILLGMGLSDVKIRKVLREEPLYLLEDSVAGI